MPMTNYIWDDVNDVILMEKYENGGTTAVYMQEPGLHGELMARDGTWFLPPEATRLA